MGINNTKLNRWFEEREKTLELRKSNGWTPGMSPTRLVRCSRGHKKYVDYAIAANAWRCSEPDCMGQRDDED